jgi:hypothetical protein
LRQAQDQTALTAEQQQTKLTPWIAGERSLQIRTGDALFDNPSLTRGLDGWRAATLLGKWLF